MEMDALDTQYYESPLGKLSIKFLGEKPGWTFKKYFIPGAGYNSTPYYIPYDSVDKEQTMEWIMYICTNGQQIINTYNPFDMFKEDPEFMNLTYEHSKRSYISKYIIPQKLIAPELITYQEEVTQRLWRTICWYNECLQKVQNIRDSIITQKKKHYEEAQRFAHTQSIQLEKEKEDNARFKNSQMNLIKSTLNYVLTDEEIEAIINRYIPEVLLRSKPHNFFKKNTLLVMQVLNRFALDHKIRVEDAETIFKELWTY